MEIMTRPQALQRFWSTDYIGTYISSPSTLHNGEYGWVTSLASKERDQRRLSSLADPLVYVWVPKESLRQAL